ncbi:SprT family zinc-dependent metalloprotease [Novosphingobium sp. ST904]|uniref:M48 family metallopeptidase n=1 Tax=Novosphingobium sp. ST904 TaxID=1684385 RepID=UPI0006C84924|nr:SprT family zinc-dependent metalloprotease [Novosphingobium sp. ST904]
MLDWLRRDPREEPVIEIAGRQVPVVIRRLAQARRMTMRLAPDGSEIRISIPRWTPSEDALEFARSKQSWLAIQIEALPQAGPLGNGAALDFRGHCFTIRHDPALPRRPVPDDGELLVGGPDTSLAARLKRWLESEARDVLSVDLAEYCHRADQPTPPLSLSSARRRWGSCATDGSIRINWRLIMAPDAVRRSVVAHEVAHLVHFDHSPAFHDFLGRIFEGSVPSANRWLRENGRSLYVPFG